MLSGLKVGQEVVLSKRGSWEYDYYFGWTVTRVTPGGQVTIMKPAEGTNEERTKIFNKHNTEIGDKFASKNYPYQICVDVAGIKADVNERVIRRNAVNALNSIKVENRVGDMYSKQSLLDVVAKLQEQLDAAKAVIAQLNQ